MTPAELAAHLQEATGAVERDEVTRNDQLTIWVPNDKWVDVAQHLKSCGRCHFDFFTFLTAVDRQDGGFEVVVHVYSLRRMHHVNLKTMVARDGGSLPTISHVWRGADWHERETWELFGIGFDGHPDLRKLLLPDEFVGNPLRKDFLLMTREAKEFPGLKEPGESSAEAKH
jgi:NADH-quinone oxidoreductase subunit C